MRTPKRFIENIKNRIVTEEMLGMVLYSINKRAKNCRDKKKEYYQKGKMSGYDLYFKSVDDYKEKEQEYYRQKDFLLRRLLKPKCIHEVVCQRERRVRYYDYEEEYERLLDKAVYSNGYMDRELKDYVEFIDVIEIDEEYKYYLFYEVDRFVFHIPVQFSEVEEELVRGILKKVTIENLETHGKEITELLSVQFVKKVISLVENEKFRFVKNLKQSA
ncbi:hypothetical protein [uncultured Clostridium sp.]|uniref:hypothetical protein n=1 Tax=uncultured Clostridium sp. TaxID=59620 RepID=UPI00258CE803|nr:hypothetical protein [uncultured Clostridium sp.]MDU1350575.1 hypothetical protein [Clostridium argentinense]